MVDISLNTRINIDRPMSTHDAVNPSPINITNRVPSTKSRRGRPLQTDSTDDAVRRTVTLTRSKSLLRAALRVWELKQRIGD